MDNHLPHQQRYCTQR